MFIACDRFLTLLFGLRSTAAWTWAIFSGVRAVTGWPIFFPFGECFLIDRWPWTVPCSLKAFVHLQIVLLFGASRLWSTLNWHWNCRRDSFIDPDFRYSVTQKAFCSLVHPDAAIAKIQILGSWVNYASSVVYNLKGKRKSDLKWGNYYRFTWLRMFWITL